MKTSAIISDCGLYRYHLFAFRSTDPRYLLAAKNPIGDENNTHLNEMAKRADIVVCAWGNSGTVDKMLLKYPNYKPFFEFNKVIYHLQLTKTGTPRHPLYLKKETKPTQYAIIPANRNFI